MTLYTEYKDENGKTVCIKKGDAIAIPLDPTNSDYQAYLRWLENPNEVEHFTPSV